MRYEHYTKQYTYVYIVLTQTQNMAAVLPITTEITVPADYEVIKTRFLQEMRDFAKVTEQVLRVKSNLNEELSMKMLSSMAENTVAFSQKVRIRGNAHFANDLAWQMSVNSDLHLRGASGVRVCDVCIMAELL